MTSLPPGQRALDHFPRFGMSAFADRFPADEPGVRLHIGGDVQQALDIGPAQWAALPRVEQHSDLHCVTTWSRLGLRWGGVRFRDVHALLAQLQAGVDDGATLVVMHGQDGYRSALPLADMLAADVLLADTLDGVPLPAAHGAPLRLVAPAHYGYKSVKHISRMMLWRDAGRYRPLGPAFMAHPRARVAQEERGQWIAGWLLRWLYRPLVRPTIARFARASAAHAARQRR